MLGAVKRRRSPREVVRQARRDVQRQHLLDAAERVFAARGYDATRMQHVAGEAGLAIATVYGIVGSKQALYAEVHRARGRELLERAMAATVGAGSAFAALLEGVKGYAEYLLAHPDYLRLHLQESQPWALHPRFTSADQGRLWREGLELTVTVFQAAIAEGSVIDESPALLGRLMIAAHQVFLGEWVAQGMKERPEAVVARMQQHVERAFATRRRNR
ncbi:MAG: TetR/AcrR family transcriptional regulator [Polyangia bacterium]